jgi:acyl carrier protein phosphodiesterase
MFDTFSTMNYLAHFLCSANQPDILVGQFIADAIKGKKYLEYPPGVQEGILIHRFIDQSTESHLACQQLRAFIRPIAGKWSPVAVDMYLDHALAIHWEKFHPQPLEDFAAFCYQTLRNADLSLPPRMAHMLPYMIEHNWLLNYASIEGMQRSMIGLSRRIPEGEGLEAAAHHLTEALPAINQCFWNYFPLLHDQCISKIHTFASGK